MQTEKDTPIDKSQARVRRMFGDIAGRYDLLNHLLSLNVDRYWRWRTVRSVPPQGDGPILDLCTGTGDLALAYLRAAGAGTPIIAADFCHSMLVIAQKKARKSPAARHLAWIEADAQHLPFPDEHFAIVSIAFGLRNVADTDRGLREIARVCRPRGRVAVLEFSMPAWPPFRQAYGWYFNRVLPRIGQALARNRYGAYNYLPASVGHFPSGEALAERMRSAGFSSVTCHPLTLGVATLYVGRKT